MYRPCNHKTSSDHMIRPVSGRLLWMCTNCGAIDQWGNTWSMWENIECGECWQTAIDWVACCDDCAKKLMTTDQEARE